MDVDEQIYHLEGRDLARHFNCKFIETSAKQRINVDEAFTNLVREIRRYNKVSDGCSSAWRVQISQCDFILGTTNGSTHCSFSTWWFQLSECAGGERGLLLGLRCCLSLFPWYPNSMVSP